MKLLTKYNRLNLATILSVFIVAGIAIFFLVRTLLIKQVDDDLNIEKREMELYVAAHNRLPEVVPVRHQTIYFSEMDAPVTAVRYQTVMGYDSSINDRDAFRLLTFGLQAEGKQYRVSVLKPLETVESLLWSIVLITAGTILVLLIAFYILNRRLLQKLWSPFFETLGRVRHFSLHKPEPLALPATRIDEFEAMNETLRGFTEKAQKDYIALKEFTENASHEIQTPLAIIRSKLDLLVQDEKLSENQSQLAQGVYESIQKLSRLNQSLLLLTKISNHQFDEKLVVDITALMREKINAFHELWEADQIQVITELEPTTLRMNPELAEILLNNLVGNATRHNHTDGRIEIEVKPGRLRISNTGANGPLDTTRMYQKFQTGSVHNGGNGLGLSIAKDVCDASGFLLDYRFTEGLHCFCIEW